jgi:carbon storage regulator
VRGYCTLFGHYNKGKKVLVLSRKVGEQIVIGQDIVITVVQIKGEKKVLVGIDAPDETYIMRKELYDQEGEE